MMDKYQAAAERRKILPSLCDGQTTIFDLSKKLERDNSCITNDINWLKARGFRFEMPTRPGKGGGIAKMPLFIGVGVVEEGRHTARKGTTTHTTDSKDRSESFLSGLVDSRKGKKSITGNRKGVTAKTERKYAAMIWKSLGGKPAKAFMGAGTVMRNAK